MKNDPAYWEKNKEYLQKHFLDNEQFLFAERTNKSILKRLLMEYVLPLAIPCAVGGVIWATAPFMLFLHVIVTIPIVLIMFSNAISGDFSARWVVITNKGIYLCYGKNCELIFNWSFSALHKIVYAHCGGKTKIYLFSKDLPADKNTIYGRIPAEGRKAVRNNILRKLFDKPLERKLFSLSRLCGLHVNKYTAERFCLLHLQFKQTSPLVKHLLSLKNEFPKLEYRKLNRIFSTTSGAELFYE